MFAQALRSQWREYGAIGCARKLSAAVRMGAPLLLRGRRTAGGVGAYFDLVTDDTRRFYGDSFHFGYFPSGGETLAEAHDAHTDLVAELAELGAGQRVLDIGCGLGAPAVRMARANDCEVTGINISREQVRQGRELIAGEGMSGRVEILLGDARSLPFAPGSFDAIVCLEVAGDICVTAADKQRLVEQLFRVLRPGGRVGFSDLALHSAPSKEDRRVLRSVFYDDGAELVTDWPAIFSACGFSISGYRCVIDRTLPTWQRIHEVYAARGEELESCYGSSIVRHTRRRIEQTPRILARLGTFPVFTARKPLDGRANGHPRL
jgi:cyclopropane fatty-acyl-phospholipid synthase-like methyltransferase